MRLENEDDEKEIVIKKNEKDLTDVKNGMALLMCCFFFIRFLASSRSYFASDVASCWLHKKKKYEIRKKGIIEIKTDICWHHHPQLHINLAI